ncbi:MAG: septal ring lytic transglycosylase RlpA family protein [Gallionellaceae bacterium]|jgi:rare lipoprotein A
MNLRNLCFILLTIALAACRANPSMRDTDQQTSRAADRAVAAEKQSEPAAQTYSTAAPSPSNGGAYLAGDGPGTEEPVDLHNIPDAVPRNEPLHRYANRPYTVLEKNYTPLTAVGNYKKRGVASWYGKKFHGQKTSIGEIYDMYGMTAASTTLPIPSYARVTNLQNNKSVIVRVNDRGPFLHERIIDLSYTAASKLGIIGSGQGMVEVESLIPDDNAPAPISPIYKAPIQVTPLPADTPATKGEAYLQLGIFRSQSGAEQFLASMRNKLSHTGKELSLSQKNGMVRVRIGPYANADTARASALDLQSMLGFKPMLSLR